jgi:hypothetical protein
MELVAGMLVVAEVGEPSDIEVEVVGPVRFERGLRRLFRR